MQFVAPSPTMQHSICAVVEGLWENSGSGQVAVAPSPTTQHSTAAVMVLYGQGVVLVADHGESNSVV